MSNFDEGNNEIIEKSSELIPKVGEVRNIGEPIRLNKVNLCGFHLMLHKLMKRLRFGLD